MTPSIDLQNPSEIAGLPADESFRRWVEAALREDYGELEQTIRVVDRGESRELNARYRGKDRATNVLSFPAELPEIVRAALDRPPLGDLAICAPLVAAEAEAQAKPVRHHWAHLVVHGVLHLLGHDHEEPAQAAVMESLEIRLLDSLGIADPYQ